MVGSDQWTSWFSQEVRETTELRPDLPHPARVYDYLLGGKDNFAADRAAGDAVLAVRPEARRLAGANRAVLRRAVRLLAGQGIGQFLDIGTGIPTVGNTHQIAQQVDREARVVYVDNDPVVLAHARALMSGAGHGDTAVLQADLREPAKILAAKEVQKLLDFDLPVVVLLVAVLHFVPDADQPYAAVAELVEALPRGSHLVLTHATGDGMTADESRSITDAYRAVPGGLTLRSRDEVARFFDGLELLDPGLVPVSSWRPDLEPDVASGAEPEYGADAGWDDELDDWDAEPEAWSGHRPIVPDDGSRVGVYAGVAYKP